MSEGNGYMKLEDWLAPDPRQYKDIEVDGRKLRIRTLTEAEHGEIQAKNLRSDGKVNLENAKDTRLRAIVVAIVNANNDPYLGMVHLKQLRMKNARFITQVYDEIADFCGLTKDSIEDHEKNCVATSGDDSQ